MLRCTDWSFNHISIPQIFFVVPDLCCLVLLVGKMILYELPCVLTSREGAQCRLPGPVLFYSKYIIGRQSDLEWGHCQFGQDWIFSFLLALSGRQNSNAIKSRLPRLLVAKPDLFLEGFVRGSREVRAHEMSRQIRTNKMCKMNILFGPGVYWVAVFGWILLTCKGVQKRFKVKRSPKWKMA